MVNEDSAYERFRRDRLGYGDGTRPSISDILRDLQIGTRISSSGVDEKSRSTDAHRFQSSGERREQGVGVVKELAAINRKYDLEVGEIWQRDIIATMTTTVIEEFVACVRESRELITAEALLGGDSGFKGLDPACMFIIRAICGPQIFTHSVLDKVRDSWCTSDLPQDLYKILGIKDNATFLDKLGSYPFSWQEKTETFVTSGILRQVMTQ